MLNKVAGKVALGLLAVGVMSVSAASYRVSLHQEANIDGKALKPGEYKVEVKENTAVLKRGKESIEVPVRAENATSKYGATQVRYADNNKLEEIRIGGTKTKLVFGSNVASSRSGMQE